MWGWRPLTDRLGLHVAKWLQGKVRDRGLWLLPRLYADFVCDYRSDEGEIVALYK